ncbi:MAG: hypothetical protein HRT68_03615 [Flavobacteriaceae bacterium]|nr:hypothetical protein [Flavobacteriaceae bacterium]
MKTLILTCLALTLFATLGCSDQNEITNEELDVITIEESSERGLDGTIFSLSCSTIDLSVKAQYQITYSNINITESEKSKIRTKYFNLYSSILDGWCKNDTDLNHQEVWFGPAHTKPGINTKGDPNVDAE